MKTFILLAIILTFQNGFAVTSVCLTKITFHEKWILSEKQIHCIENDPNFSLTTKRLCSGDQSEVSPSYAKFLKFKVKIDEAFSKLQAATTPGDRALANAELQDQKQAQNTFAVTYGIWDALDLINSLKHNCEQ